MEALISFIMKNRGLISTVIVDESNASVQQVDPFACRFKNLFNTLRHERSRPYRHS